MTAGRLRPVLVEGVGTGLLLFVIVGSGITAERTTADPGIQLILHALAVGAGLTALIAGLAGVSGAHFNPAVTVGFWRRGTMDTPTALTYIGAQIVGAVAGVVVAHLAFAEPLVAFTTAGQVTGGAVVGEMVGTFFLVLLILTLVDQDRTTWIPAAVGGWVTAMVLAAPSGGVLNPAVALARSLTDSYTGIALTTALVFVAAQLAAGVVAVVVSRQLAPVLELKGT